MEVYHATLIGLRPLTETSRLVRWCTPDAGIIDTVARGAVRPGSAFRGKLDLFFESEISISRSRKSTLHNLREVELLDARSGLRSDYGKTLAASYFVHLIEMTCEKETPIPEQFDLLGRALGYLAEAKPTRKAVLHFEKELAGILGLDGHNNPRSALSQLFGELPRQRNELLQRIS